MKIKCKFCGQENEITVKSRSLKENNYYWGIVVELISQHTGFTPQETHEALKWKFLRIVKGKLESCRSTTELSIAEFETFLSQIRQWASEELNCWIPEPNSPITPRSFKRDNPLC